jgi:acyl-CoA synthetase (AMP-forming)/AMP-acid ligase II
MIISGGVNIHPQAIEDALVVHPDVLDAAVIGVPDAEMGEQVKAIVEPAPGVVPSEALAENCSPTCGRESRATWCRAQSTSSTRCRVCPPASSTSRGCKSAIGGKPGTPTRHPSDRDTGNSRNIGRNIEKIWSET